MMHAIHTPILAISLDGDLLFFLVFAVFAAIRLLTGLSGKNKSSAGTENDKDPVEEEQIRRQRREALQAEIRQRIAEARANAGQKPTPAAPQQTLRQDSPLARTRAEFAQPKPRSIIQPPPAEDIMARLARAQKEEEAAREKFRQALAKTRARKQTIKTAGTVARNDKTASRDAVLDMLRHPEGLKEAFVVSELLSRPISERGNESCYGTNLP